MVNRVVQHLSNLNVILSFYHCICLKSPDCTSLLPEISETSKASFCERAFCFMKLQERRKQPTPIANVQITKKLLKKAFRFFFNVISIPNAGWAVDQKIVVDISLLLDFQHIMDLDILLAIVESCEFQFDTSDWDLAIKEFGSERPEFLALIAKCLKKRQKFNFIKRLSKQGMAAAAVLVSDEDHIEREGLLSKLDLNSTDVKKITSYCTPVILARLFKCVLTHKLSHDRKRELLEIIIKEEISPSAINLAELLEVKSKASKFLVQNQKYLLYLLNKGVDIQSGSKGPIATVLKWPSIEDKVLSRHKATVMLSLLRNHKLVSDLTDQYGGTPVHVAVNLALDSSEIV